MDEHGKLLEELNSDSIWNYHVWNELWMERPDLTNNALTYNGWQAVDSTPQEMSDGIYRCGPAPVRAVKYGEVLRPYDCNFLYAEVNAGKIDDRINYALCLIFKEFILSPGEIRQLRKKKLTTF